MLKMYIDKNILAIIPARGGSKGLPQKNILPLLGKPLIGYSIEQAMGSKYLDELFISTDDQQIADISEEFGVKVNSLRPKELANDNSSSIDVVLYTIDHLSTMCKNFDLVMLLEPTSPLRESSDIDKAIELLVNTNKAESIVGISKVEGTHPSFLVSLEDNFLRSYLKNNFKVLRRQELEDLFFFEGSLYLSYVDVLKKRKNFYHENTIGYIVPKWKSFEVDDLTDFIIIESILNAKLKGLIK